jgi:hypothetical protein
LSAYAAIIPTVSVMTGGLDSARQLLQAAETARDPKDDIRADISPPVTPSLLARRPGPRLGAGSQYIVVVVNIVKILVVLKTVVV